VSGTFSELMEKKWTVTF